MPSTATLKPPPALAVSVDSAVTATSNFTLTIASVGAMRRPTVWSSPASLTPFKMSKSVCVTKS